MRVASAQKLRLAAEMCHVHSFVVLFYYFLSYVAIQNFDWMFFIKLICWISAHPFFKNLVKQNASNFAVHIQNSFDSTNLVNLIWLCISSDS